MVTGEVAILGAIVRKNQRSGRCNQTAAAVFAAVTPTRFPPHTLRPACALGPADAPTGASVCCGALRGYAVTRQGLQMPGGAEQLPVVSDTVPQNGEPPGPRCAGLLPAWEALPSATFLHLCHCRPLTSCSSATPGAFVLALTVPPSSPFSHVRPRATPLPSTRTAPQDAPQRGG
jgi:hypothetical protein